MRRQISLAVAVGALALAPSVFAESVPMQGATVEPSRVVVTAAMPSASRSRTQVLAELTCARAAGELALLHADAWDPWRAQAARMRAARSPACSFQTLGR